jgi:hypothetical protein
MREYPTNNSRIMLLLANLGILSPMAPFRQSSPHPTHPNLPAQTSPGESGSVFARGCQKRLPRQETRNQTAGRVFLPRRSDSRRIPEQ